MSDSKVTSLELVGNNALAIINDLKLDNIWQPVANQIINVFLEACFQRS